MVSRVLKHDFIAYLDRLLCNIYVMLLLMHKISASTIAEQHAHQIGPRPLNPGKPRHRSVS